MALLIPTVGFFQGSFLSQQKKVVGESERKDKRSKRKKTNEVPDTTVLFIDLHNEQNRLKFFSFQNMKEYGDMQQAIDQIALELGQGAKLYEN